ncbi:MAG TPA: hypothetical protein VGG35_11960 [Streptosporangiaceae bacterium]
MTAGQAPGPPSGRPGPASAAPRPAPPGSGELDAEEPGQPAFRGEFDAELRRDAAYESGLAVKALIALAVVAVLITIRLLGF